jgi:capsular exopolysaccharide synthesis family protein
MSRIYEALQKAESERKLERHDRDLRAPLEQLDPLPAPTAVADYEPAISFSEPDMVDSTEAIAAPHPIGGHLNLGKVAHYPWNLSESRLPALLERGPAIEQFRSLRSRLYEARDIRPIKSLLVSSGLPQEGKSFISANLALSLARHKTSKVLLIDGDMRRYTAHELLGTVSHPGLADYLAGKATIEEIMQRSQEPADPHATGRIALQNLTFIPGGNGGDKAADLSGNARFGELLRTAAPYFDWIIVDSSPVLPVSDAVNLARSCDGVLLVARSGVTKYPVAQRAASELRASNILGFVLNAVHEAPQVGNYYGYNANKE